MSILNDIIANTALPVQHPPTEEQQHFVDLLTKTDDNIIMWSYAGTGKTTTLELGEKAVKKQPILYLVFNTRNAKEATDRMLSTTACQTFNGCGHRILSETIGKRLVLNQKKSNDILKVIIQDTRPKRLQEEIREVFWEIIGGVAMAKALGYIPDGQYPDTPRLCTREQLIAALEEQPGDLVLDLVDEVLTRSIQAAYAGSIDFNDQIYVPAMFGGAFPRFPLVLVDEMQDLNPTNYAMLERLVKGRLVGVGDPWQNIYGFRGAKTNAMAEAQVKWNMTKTELSVSFRCPQRVVEAARWRVPNFKWIKPGGHVEQLKELVAGDFADDATIICRNNAPLFKLGMQLLQNGRSISIAGSDVGPKLVSLMRKLGPEHTPKATVLNAIEDWRLEKLAKESTTANDMADCMKVFATYGDDLGTAIKYLEHLFAQHGTIKLLTGHKSKGLEFDCVYMLDPFLMRQDDQDLNLRYVSQTRSKDRLYEINSETIRW